jgi:hypothetical protein
MARSQLLIFSASRLEAGLCPYIAGLAPPSLPHQSAGPSSSLCSPECVEKLSEKARSYPKRGPTRHSNRSVQPVLAPIDGPNSRPERNSHPFSDGFGRGILRSLLPEVATWHIHPLCKDDSVPPKTSVLGGGLRTLVYWGASCKRRSFF